MAEERKIKSQRKTALINLIKGCLYISEELKRSLIANIDRISDKDLENLENTFNISERKQKKMIESMALHDADFLKDLKIFKKDEIRKSQKEIEKRQRKNENPEDLLKQIDEI